jgi:hypothetical protein
MIPYESSQGDYPLRTFSSEDNTTSLIGSPDGRKEENTGPKFEPGDHIIRWKLLKFMMWPIQVHGIVLSVESTSASYSDSGTDGNNKSSGGVDHPRQSLNDNNYKFTIADFGYTSSQNLDEKKDGKKKDQNFFQRFGNINHMMKSFYDNEVKNNSRLRNSRPSSPGRPDMMEMESDYSFFEPSPDNSPSRSKPNNGNANANVKDDNSDMKIKDMKYTDFDDSTVGDESGSESGRPRFQVIEITDPTDLKKWHKIDYGKSLFKKNKLKETVAKSSRNLLRKMNFLKKPSSKYSTLAMDQDDAGSGSAGGPTALDDNTPKLPKSDPHKIVLARTQYILDQQELPKSEQSLPPYHILYSNSECLAVWCKTGKFSTLQAAIFLHSTAVGNAKSTFLMTGAVAATQPWLIPVVGIYGAVAVGMPFLILKKCKEKWKKSEQDLTDGFWSTANSDIFVAAIENWSGISTSTEDSSKKEGSERGRDLSLSGSRWASNRTI